MGRYQYWYQPWNEGTPIVYDATTVRHGSDGRPDGMIPAGTLIRISADYPHTDDLQEAGYHRVTRGQTISTGLYPRDGAEWDNLVITNAAVIDEIARRRTGY